MGRSVLIYDLLSSAARRNGADGRGAGQQRLEHAPAAVHGRWRPLLPDLGGQRSAPARLAGRHGRLPGLGGNRLAARIRHVRRQRRPDTAGHDHAHRRHHREHHHVFIYELDSTGGNPSPRWSCPIAACTTTYGSAVRTSGHQLVVVDLKIKWQPVLARFLGIPTVLTFDAQSVDRMEF